MPNRQHHSADQPMEVLDDCHRDIVAQLANLRELLQRVNGLDVDEAAQVMARQAHLYFSTTALQHHLDEELHVFPAVLALHDGRLGLLVVRLQRDHRDMEKRWAAVRQALARVAHADAKNRRPFSDVDQADMDAFVTIYKDHIKAEEEQVYPQAKQALSLDQLVVMSRDMVGRRGR